MRMSYPWAIVLGLACSIPAPALAQPAGIPATRPSGSTLVFNKKVQDDLGLGADDIERIATAARKVREKYKDDFAKLKTLEPGERVELIAKVDKEVLKAIGDILKPEQMKRLKQIEFQQLIEQRGPGAFREADVAKELQLTDKQKKRVAEVFNQYNQDIGNSLLGGNRDQIPALRKEALDEVRKSLDDEQKKKLDALTGKPFAFPGPGSVTFGLPGATPDAPWAPALLPASGVARLLLDPSVRKELKLTADQSKSIQQGLDKVQNQFADKVQAVFRVGPGEKVDPKSVTELSKKVESEFRKTIEAVLEPGQLKRLHQIELQQEGLRALNNKEVVAALKLTEDQKDRVKTLTEDLNSELQKLQPTSGRGRRADPASLQEILQARKKLFKEAADKIPSLLTPDQGKKWQEMTGDPFELDPKRPGEVNSLRRFPKR